MGSRGALDRAWSATAARHPGTGHQPGWSRDRSGAVLDDAPDRLAGYLGAYDLIEQVQSGEPLDVVTAPLRQAVDRDWPDVETLLHYALLLGVRQKGGDAAPHLAGMRRLVADGDDPVLHALTLAAGAQWPLPEGADVEQCEAELALAVAVLEPAPDAAGDAALDRALALVACALSYSSRGLWELEEALYERASECLLAVPPELVTVRQRVTDVVLFNRREALLSTACERLEVEDHEGARTAARSGLSLPRPTPGRLPECWHSEADACCALLAAVLGDPAPPAWPVDAYRGSWPGYPGMLLVADALRAAGSGDDAAAAALAEQALATFVPNLVPSVRDLALALAARRPPRHPEALRYAHEHLQWRRQSRLNLIGSSWARIEAARQQLEYERLTERAYLDQLTGLANRHASSRYLDRVRRDQQQRRVAVLVVDLDTFKAVNDTHGHLVGDHVLKQISVALADGTRPTDLVARLGGDEFLLVLDDIPPEDAVRRAEHLIRAVAGHPWADVAPGLAVTVTVGLSSGPGHLIDDLVAEADRNLYRAKNTRRGTLGLSPVAATASPPAP